LRNYPGAPLPPEEVALVRGEGGSDLVRSTDCDLLAVDGMTLGMRDDRAEVLPGRHSVRLLLWEHQLITGNDYTLFCEAGFDAVADRHYLFRVAPAGLPEVAMVVREEGDDDTVLPVAARCGESLLELETLLRRENP
jgi:hypothetical protein